MLPFSFFFYTVEDHTPTGLGTPRACGASHCAALLLSLSFFCFLSEWLGVLQRSPTSVSCGPFSQAQGSVPKLTGYCRRIIAITLCGSLQARVIFQQRCFREHNFTTYDNPHWLLMIHLALLPQRRAQRLCPYLTARDRRLLRDT